MGTNTLVGPLAYGRLKFTPFFALSLLILINKIKVVNKEKKKQKKKYRQQ